MNSPVILKSLAELIRVVKRKQDVDEIEVSNLCRLLRPQSSETSGHVSAIKHKIREQILVQADLSNSNGPLQIAEFDRLLDDLHYQNSYIVPAALSILEPLSFHKHVPASSVSYFNVSKAKMALREEMEAKRVLDSSNIKHFIPAGHLAATSESEAVTLRSDVLWISPETEAKLLQDLLYIFQGIGGKHIKYDSRADIYIIDPTLKLSCPAKDTILCLCELGWLYSKVEAYVTKIEVAEFKGLIAQAFGFSLQEELHDYYRLLAVLEQELARRNERMQQVSESDQDFIREKNESSSGLTILRLRAWMQEPIDRMCLMARLVEGAGPLSGGALASRLHGHSMHGDPAISSLVQRMMNSVCSPLYSMINRWILHGELLDPNKEFFIGYRVGVPAQSMWQETYFLRSSMLPSFLSPALAQTILVIGKSINFMRACFQRMSGKPSITQAKQVKEALQTEEDLDEGGEKVVRLNKSPYKSPKKRGAPMPAPSMANALEGSGDVSMATSRNWQNISNGDVVKNDNIWSIDGTKKGSDGDTPTWSPFGLSEVNEIEASLQALRYGGELRLNELVTKVSVDIDHKLLHMMLKDFSLPDHFLALKKFILLGQGDFVTCLMDEIGPELKKRATQLYRHNLSGMLEGALRASNAQFEPSYVLDRVGVRLLEPTAGDTGWEVFSLDYAVDAPLTAVVHTEAINKYRVAFHMLWRLKRVEWTLSLSWKQLMCFQHTKGAELLPRLKPVLHRCTLHRARMTHFINNLCGFFMFEVVETAWTTLEASMATARCLDDVIKAHDAYLDEIQDRALLSAPHEALALQIQQMIQSILRFCNLEETLISDAMSSIARKRALREAGDRRTSAGGWGITSNDDMDDTSIPGSIDGVPGYVINRIEEAAKEYTTQFNLLMSMLQEQGDKAGDIVRYLTFRLDFNGFFSGSESVAV